MFDVTTYGATGDGTTDDRSAIQDTIDACEAAGGGTVYFPIGVYLLDSAHPVETGVSLLIDGDNVLLEGFHQRMSVIKLGEDLNISLVNFQDCANVGISKLEIDGQRTTQTANSHGIRQGGSTDGLVIRDVYVHEVSSYGIGLQYGQIKDCVIENVVIEDTGGDGIDIKNQDHNNQNNKMHNITVRRAGLRSDLSGSCCLDIRGPWELSNITCIDWKDDANTSCVAGIRFKEGESTDTSGTGGHYSTLTNFYVEANSTNTETVGVAVEAYQCSIGQGFVRDCKYGVKVLQSENTITGVVTKGCVVGFSSENSTCETDGDRTVFSGCVARSNTETGFKVFTKNVQLNGCLAMGNPYGVNLRSTCDKALISGVSSNSSTSNFYVQSGATYTLSGFIS